MSKRNLTEKKRVHIWLPVDLVDDIHLIADNSPGFSEFCRIALTRVVAQIKARSDLRSAPLPAVTIDEEFVTDE